MSSDRFFLPAPAPCARQLLPRGGLRGVGLWRLVSCVQRLQSCPERHPTFGYPIARHSSLSDVVRNMFCVPTQSDGPGCRNPDAQRGRLLSRHAPDRSSGTANGNFQERGPRTTAASSPNWPKCSWRFSSLATSGRQPTLSH